MMLLDVNQDHGLALIVNDDNSDPRYVPLTEVQPTKPVDQSFWTGTYLRQAHYVARVLKPGSLTVNVAAMLDGWKRYNDQEWMRKL